MRQITSFATLGAGRDGNGSYGSVVVEGGANGQINAAGNYYNGLLLITASDINSDPPYEMVDQFRIIRNLFFGAEWHGAGRGRLQHAYGHQ